MKIYLASRFRTVHEVNKVADSLIAKGHEIVSTWHRTDALGEYKATPMPTGPQADMLSVYVACRDISQINDADMVILYSKDCEATPGGMWFEAGYAYAKDKKVVVLGPRTNVFCHILEIINEDLDLVGFQ